VRSEANRFQVFLASNVAYCLVFGCALCAPTEPGTCFDSIHLLQYIHSIQPRFHVPL